MSNDEKNQAAMSLDQNDEKVGDARKADEAPEGERTAKRVKIDESTADDKRTEPLLAQLDLFVYDQFDYEDDESIAVRRIFHGEEEMDAPDESRFVEYNAYVKRDSQLKVRFWNPTGEDVYMSRIFATVDECYAVEGRGRFVVKDQHTFDKNVNVFDSTGRQRTKAMFTRRTQQGVLLPEKLIINFVFADAD